MRSYQGNKGNERLCVVRGKPYTGDTAWWVTQETVSLFHCPHALSPELNTRERRHTQPLSVTEQQRVTAPAPEKLDLNYKAVAGFGRKCVYLQLLEL